MKHYETRMKEFPYLYPTALSDGRDLSYLMINPKTIELRNNAALSFRFHHYYTVRALLVKSRHFPKVDQTCFDRWYGCVDPTLTS